MKPREHDELVEHIFRVCAVDRAHVRTARHLHTGKHAVEVDIPGGTILRVEHKVSGIATRRMLEIFRALPDGALSLKTKRAGLLASLAKHEDPSALGHE